MVGDLAAESVEGSPLPLQSVHDVHSSDRLSLGVLCIGDGITDDVLEEHLEYSSGLLVDQSGYTLDPASASQTTDCWLGDSLDVVTEHLAMTLCASLAQSFSSLATSRHVKVLVQNASLFSPKSYLHAYSRPRLIPLDKTPRTSERELLTGRLADGAPSRRQLDQ